MVKKKGKRYKKALEKAKRQKGMKDKIPTDNFTKLLFVGQQLKELAEEMEVDYISITEDDEISGPVWEPDSIEKSGLTTKERYDKRQRG